MTTIIPVKAFVITGDRNSEGRRDFVGAFDVEAKNFMKLHKIPAECRLKVDLSKNELGRKKQVIDFFQRMVDLGYRSNDTAIFCHGFTARIELGFRIGTVGDLVKCLQSVKLYASDLDPRVGESPGPSASVILYCCSTGDGPGKNGDNGFADKLRDKLCEMGDVNCVVEAHVTAGHTTQNSQKKRYMGMGSPVGGVGGTWIVAPGTTLFVKWRKALQTDFRFKFHWMTIADIHQYLIDKVK